MNSFWVYISGVAVGGLALTAFLVSKNRKIRLKGSAKEIVDFFTTNGFSFEQAVGIAGNLQEESQFSTIATGDNGTAFGIAQWRGSRLDNLKNFALKKNKDVRDFYLQLQFILHEFQTDEKRAFEKLLQSETVYDATINFAKYYERPQASTYPKRVSYANSIYNQIQNL